MPLSSERHHKAYGALAAVCVIWGTTYLAIRVALETIPPALVGGLRYTCAGAILALLLAARAEPLPTVAQWGGHAVLGILMIGLGNGGVVWAQQWVPTGIAAVVVASTPFWMTSVEACWPGGDRVSRRVLIGLSVGFGGILLLVWPDVNASGATGRAFVSGIVALQVACLGWAIGSSYGKRHERGENALAAAAMQMVFGGLAMLVAATVRNEWGLLDLTARTLTAELYLVFVGSLAGFSAYVYALKHLPISIVSLYAYVNPVIAVALGTLLLGEPFGWRVVVAAMTVFAGIAIVGRQGPTRGAAGAASEDGRTS